MAAGNGRERTHQHLALERNIEQSNPLRQGACQGSEQDGRDAEHRLIEERRVEKGKRHGRFQMAPRIARKRMTTDCRTMVSTRGISTERSIAKPPVCSAANTTAAMTEPTGSPPASSAASVPDHEYCGAVSAPSV